MKTRLLIPLVCLLPCLFFSSCSPGTEITKSWSDDNFTGKPFKKILVMAVVKDQWVRGAYETTLYDDLAGSKVEVIRSMDVIEKSGELTKEVFEEKFLPLGIDAVVISREISREDRERIFYNLPSNYYGMYSYYSTAYSYVLQPSYIGQDPVIHIETNLYDVKTTRLVWSAVSASYSPRKASEVIMPLTKLVARSLRDEGFVR
jgi:hypothetical protein